MKKFIAFTEKNRVRGLITVSVHSGDDDAFGDVITNFSFSSTSNRGTRAEIIAHLVSINHLSEKAIDDSDYPNYGYVRQNAKIFIIESSGESFYTLI